MNQTADLPATPPADERDSQESNPVDKRQLDIAVNAWMLALGFTWVENDQGHGLWTESGRSYSQIQATHWFQLIKSHAEQEKAAADLAIAKEITWHIANLAYAHGFRGSPFIQNELKLAQERLAELRDGAGKA